MFKLVEFFQKRPKDRTILLGRIIFGLLIALLVGFNFSDITILHLPDAVKPYEFYKKLGLFVFAFIPLFLWASNLCIAKRKHIRIAQISFGLILIIMGSWFVDTKTIVSQDTPIVVQNGSLDYGMIADTENTSEPVNVGFWLAFLGIFPILAGISGKCITSKCLKYGEVIKKIRV